MLRRMEPVDHELIAVVALMLVMVVELVVVVVVARTPTAVTGASSSMIFDSVASKSLDPAR